MSKFDISQDKIFKLWFQSNKTFDEIQKQETINADILAKEERFNSLSTQIKSIIDATEDWVQPTFIPFQGIFDRYAGYSWNFTFNNMTDELLNAFSFDFGVKTGSGDVYTTLTPSNVNIRKRVTYQRNQSLSDPDVFDLVIDASISFEIPGDGLQTDLWVKLFVLQNNPYLFTNG